MLNGLMPWPEAKASRKHELIKLQSAAAGKEQKKTGKRLGGAWEMGWENRKNPAEAEEHQLWALMSDRHNTAQHTPPHTQQSIKTRGNLIHK